MATQKIHINDDELKKKLTPEQYKILREKGTEVPFSSPLLGIHEKGVMFNCAACGSRLFSSDTKFDSGTGWPSFDQALPGTVQFHDDASHGTKRMEVTCASCGSHLGHMFNDGPKETTGKRFCINGACLLADNSLKQ